MSIGQPGTCGNSFCSAQHSTSNAGFALEALSVPTGVFPFPLAFLFPFRHLFLPCLLPIFLVSRVYRQNMGTAFPHVYLSRLEHRMELVKTFVHPIYDSK